MKKPITFKQAGIIVVSLHVIGLVGFMQYTSYKAKLAKEVREAKKIALLADNRLQQDWNNSNIKLKVVATPPPKVVNQSANTSNKTADIQQALQKVVAETSNKIKQGVDQVKTISTNQQIVKTKEYPKSTVWKVKLKEEPIKTTAISKKPNSSKPKINVASIKNNVDKIKSEIQTIKSYNFNNGIITQTTEEIQQRMSSHIVLR